MRITTTIRTDISIILPQHSALFRIGTHESTTESTSTIPHIFGANYVLNGHGTYTDHNGTNHPIRPGTFFVRHPFFSHSIHIDHSHPYKDLYLCCEQITAQTLAELNLLPDTPIQQAQENDKHILNTFTKINNIFIQGTATVLTILKHIEALMEAVSISAQHIDSDLARIHTACIQLADFSLTPLPRIQDIATAASYSERQFRRLFKKYTGISPHKYRMSKRIEKACTLLTAHSIEQVSDKLGYNNRFEFSKQFKEHMGQTPKQFADNLLATLA